jgi:hypothetical protein
LSHNTDLTASYYDEFISTSQNNFFYWNLFNESKNYRFKDINSNNLKFLSFEKNNRSTANQKLRTITQNFNTFSNVELNKTLSSNSNQYNVYLQGLNNWNNISSTQKLLSTSTMSSLTRNPIQTTNPAWNELGYDRTTAFSSSETPDILRGKEDMAPDYLFNTYWHSYWKNIAIGQTFSNVHSNINKLESFYLPTVAEYSEYDFRNWQSVESLEDSFWESNYSSLAHDDYMSVKADSKTSELFNKTQTLYNTGARGDLLLKSNSSSKLELPVLTLSCVSEIYPHVACYLSNDQITWLLNRNYDVVIQNEDLLNCFSILNF